jgi:hypothetical protein
MESEMSQEFKLLHRGDFTIYPTQSWFQPRDHVGEIRLLDGFSRDIASMWLDEDYYTPAAIPRYYSIYDFEGPIGIEEWQILSKFKRNETLEFLGFEDTFLIYSACLYHPETVLTKKETPYVWQLPSDDPADILKVVRQDVIVYFCDSMLVGSTCFFTEGDAHYMDLRLPGDQTFISKKQRFIIKR